jgi:hypothetical protein
VGQKWHQFIYIALVCGCSLFFWKFKGPLSLKSQKPVPATSGKNIADLPWIYGIFAGGKPIIWQQE